MQDMVHLIWVAWVTNTLFLPERQRIIRRSRFCKEAGFFLFLLLKICDWQYKK